MTKWQFPSRGGGDVKAGGGGFQGWVGYVLWHPICTATLYPSLSVNALRPGNTSLGQRATY